MITDKMMSEAADQLHEALLNSLPNEEECGHQFSKGFERKMKAVIRRGKHPVRYRVMQSAASIALVIWIGFMAILAVSPTARAAFVGWVREQYASFTKYFFAGEAHENTESAQYELTNVPEGFEEVTRNEVPSKTTVYYENPVTEQIIYFTYSQSLDTIASYLVKSDRFTTVEIHTDTLCADYYQSNDPEQANAIIWIDDETSTFFRISASLEKEQLVQLAENISEKR